MAELVREYKMSDADLMFIVGDFVIFMNRDISSMITRGVSALDITAFETLGNEFEVFPTDAYYLADVTAEAEAKDLARTNCYDKVQYITGFVEQKWGLDSYQYRKLGIKGLSHRRDKEFIRIARIMVEVVTNMIADLTPIGLAQADIDALEAELQVMEDKEHGIVETKALRDEKAEERIEKGNELYGFVKQYSTIGKLIWENVSNAKYEDYLLYHKSSTLPGKPLNLNYDVIQFVMHWDASPNSDTYEAEFRLNSTGFEWAVCYEGVALEFPHNPGHGNWLYRIRGKNAEGSGTWSDEFNVILPV